MVRVVAVENSVRYSLLKMSTMKSLRPSMQSTRYDRKIRCVYLLEKHIKKSLHGYSDHTYMALLKRFHYRVYGSNDMPCILRTVAQEVTPTRVSLPKIDNRGRR